MNSLNLDALTHLAFSISENRGVFAILLGSGVSRSAGIPTGWEITLDLIRRVAAAREIKDQGDWAAWYRAETGEEPDYSKILAMLSLTQTERRAILHSYIEPDANEREQGLKVPTKAHEAVADLVATGHIKVIITTNFDRLMETALRSRGIEPTVVASVDALSGAEPLAHSACYIFKLHGDYKDARLLNTNDELAGYPSEYNTLLDRILDEYGLVICGWSGEWDTALRQAILRAPNRRYPTFWATRSELRPNALELATARSARVVNMASADAFFKELRDKVVTLDQIRRRNPIGLELTVATAKRFLVRAEYRIELEDLISKEAELLFGLLSGDAYRASETPNTASITFRVRQLDAASEGLAKLAGALGRWGAGSEFYLVRDLIYSLYRWARKGSGGGYTAWSNLREYPAVLIFTAYGLGLVRAERWKDLSSLFNLNFTQEDRETKILVDTLFSNWWDGGSNDFWRLFEGLERRKSPLSDHLYDLFKEWGASFTGLRADYDLLYDRFEFLAAFAGFSQEPVENIEFAKSNARGDVFAYLPSARFGWNGSSREVLVRELRQAEVSRKLLEAGFGNGSEKMIELYIETVGHFAGRMRW